MQIRIICLNHSIVHLKEAIDLLACDYTGLSDPYVKFIVDGKTLHKSKIIYKNLNPIWNEHIQIPVQNLEQALLVQVRVEHHTIGSRFQGHELNSISYAA